MGRARVCEYVVGGSVLLRLVEVLMWIMGESFGGQEFLLLLLTIEKLPARSRPRHSRSGWEALTGLCQTKDD